MIHKFRKRVSRYTTKPRLGFGRPVAVLSDAAPMAECMVGASWPWGRLAQF